MDLINSLLEGSGNLAEWATSVVALLALLVAVVAARYTGQTNRSQQETLRLQQREYEEAQAGQISFWHHYDDVGDYTDAVHILNASDTPIHEVALLAEHPIEAVWYSDLVMAANGVAQVIQSSAMTQIPNRLVFRDKLGRVWFRDLNGKLRQRTHGEKRPVAVLITSYLMGFSSRSDPPAEQQGRSWEDWPESAPGSGR